MESSPAGLIPGSLPGRQQHGHQQHNDRDHHQHLDQSKGAALGGEWLVGLPYPPNRIHRYPKILTLY